MHGFVGSGSAARVVERRKARRTEKKVERMAAPDGIRLAEPGGV